ncbi:aspartate carbamoyltransferase catalytic subunit [Heyndrickxia ginsengihumi]|uniref:Aspartate carbamoyltransferase n=1 Tax=Heyndrickxia ginsengihumi TaxID=363870 RepID=A0A0A6VD46_9BACI|nr:aspartate carbamoyltransferase catalytic subunit [Heyndrickxia ginsengihumi]KHD86200.1 aspartate carbamoyltransferase catalytic subunit [Heyndrickxia ginsengihumi]MBE6183443.1 aspartate carbamoyltransferase catalytic subunit [Bacillus sp. (in: firmicutes)]MCM3022426.1 aspartate carbamoyltransferase catalytic subunit [Heyndrickxia ginsengihumi]
MKHFLSISDMNTTEIMELLQEADTFSRGEQWKTTEPVFVANLFYEPSTRTKCSFEIAERRLGLELLPFEIGNSSVLKGETLYDTIKTLQSIGVKLAVIRHKQDHYYEQLINHVDLSIVNGGDGSGQHPSQCLLDLLTIKQEFGYFNGLNVLIVGDIVHSRVARSNYEALRKLGANVKFSGPRDWFDPTFLQTDYIEINQGIKEADVVMLLRIQHERHEQSAQFSKADYHIQYGLTLEREQQMKQGSIIMHPGPVNRDVEIASELVEGKRSRIFKQMENGVFARMAILKTILQNEKVVC